MKNVYKKSCLIVSIFLLLLCDISDAKGKIKRADAKKVSQTLKSKDQTGKKEHSDSIPKDMKKILELSEKIRIQESRWVEADKHQNYLNQRIHQISESIANCSEAFTKNLDLIKKKENVLSLVLQKNKEVMNSCYKNIANMQEHLNSLRANLKELKTKKCDAENRLKDLYSSLYCAYPQPREINKIYADTAKNITAKAKCLENLIDFLNFEVNIGNLKSLPKCKVESKCISFPAEFCVSNDFMFNKKNYISKEIQIRRNGFVFSPITGTVVFVNNYKNFGCILGVSNNEKGVVLITGLEHIFVTVGDVVFIGQVVATAKNTIFEDTYSFLRIIAKK